MFRILALPFDIDPHDPAGNIRRVEALAAAHNHAEAPVDLIVLPEMWARGFHMAPEVHAEAVDGPSAACMGALAARHNALVMGSVATRTDGGYVNRLLCVGPQGPVAAYDKRHLFRMAGEDKHYLPGTGRVVVQWRGVRILPLVCYDLRFPVWSRRVPGGLAHGAEAELDYDLAVYVANWPAARDAQWEMLLRARAIENQAYVLGVNRIGTDLMGHAYGGRSLLADFRGEGAHCGAAETLVGAVDMAALEDYRARFPAWIDTDGFALWGVPPAQTVGED